MIRVPQNFALIAVLFITQPLARSSSESTVKTLLDSRLSSRDLKFYPDNEGVENYTQTMHDSSQMFRQSAPIRRELTRGTLEVYPIKNDGAIEAGSHRFCHVENGRADCGTFKFVHIWRRTAAGWQISRVVSYGH